jgi:hypothetical protein
MVIIMLLPLCGWSQVRDASPSTPYDSIQDVQLRRLERNLGRGLEMTDEKLQVTTMRSDSLLAEVEMLLGRVERMEKKSGALQDSITSLKTRVESAETEAYVYRRKLERTLWLAGSALGILSLILFVFLWLYSLKTRVMLERLRKRVSRLKKVLKLQRKWTLRTTQKAVRKGLQSRKGRRR